MKNWQQMFKDPPREYSAAAFWFWNGTLEEEKLRQQLRMMADKGVYAAFMHARAYLKTPYLEKEWWEAVDACLDEGEKQDVYLWLYDEYAWPSGTAGSTFEYGFQKPSRVLAEGPKNMAKGLEVWYPAAEELTKVCELLEGKINEERAEGTGKLIGAYLVFGKGENQKIVRCFSAADVLDGADGAAEPARLVCFIQKVYPQSVDYLNPETIRSFLGYTHEEYAARYEKYFGNRIPGVFFDEIYMASDTFAWTEHFAEAFQKQHGYDLLDALPWLLSTDTERGKKTREDYYRTASALYERAFFAQISQWCGEHRLMLTGHTEEELPSHPRRQGDYFRTMRHLQIPGADCHDYRYRLPRNISFHEPKYAVSVARAYGRKRAMSEAMGGAGWGCSLQEFRRGLHTLGVMGISMYVLHGLHYECEHQGSQGDWPSSFFYQNPYWKYFKIFADEARRISWMNTVGVPVVQTGIYYPIREMQRHSRLGNSDETAMRIQEGFHRSLYELIEHQTDVDMLDEETLLSSELRGSCLVSGGRQIRTVLFPEEWEPTPELVSWMESFTKNGGLVIFYETSRRGTKAAEGIDEKAAGSMTEGGYPVVSPDRLWQYLRREAGLDAEILSGDTREIYISHRRTEEADLYFISNSEDCPKRCRILFSARGPVWRMSAETGEIEPAQPYLPQPADGSCRSPERKAIPVRYRLTGEGTVVDLSLAEDEACWLMIGRESENPGRETKPAGHCREAVYRDHRDRHVITGKWSFLPLGKRYDEVYDDAADETELELPLAVFSSSLHPEGEPVRICNTVWEPGNCGRHLSLWEASWITRRPHWGDSIEESDLYFRREITLKGEVRRARFCVAAVNSAEIFVNGKPAGTVKEGEMPAILDVSSLFVPGTNLIAVHVHNEKPYFGGNFCSAQELPPDRMISLLFEARIETEDEGGRTLVTLASDAEWIVTNEGGDDWEKENLHPRAVRHDPSHQLNRGNAGAWLYAWERGKPPLLPWGDLPLFGETIAWPVTLTYQLTLPAGTAAIEEPDVRGEASYLLDGQPVSFNGRKEISPRPRTRTLTIRVLAADRTCGLRRPVRICLRPVPVPYGEWASLGLGWFSGRAVYRNRFTCTLANPLSEDKPRRFRLVWGQRNSCAEIWINHRLAGVRAWAPYEMDITELVKEGENEIAIVVVNLAAPERRYLLVDEGMALGWNRYWNEDNIDRESEDLMSGLLGPVWIDMIVYGDN